MAGHLSAASRRVILPLLLAYLVSCSAAFTPSTSSICLSDSSRRSCSSSASTLRLPSVHPTSSADRAQQHSSLLESSNNANDRISHNKEDEAQHSYREARIMRPLRTLSAAAAMTLAVGPATPFVTSAADEKTKAAISSFNSALVEYFGPSLPAATASRRVLTTLASKGGYLPNQFQSKTLLGSTFCNVGKADKSTFEGQLEVGLGKASLPSSGSAGSAKGAAPININGIAGVPSAGAIKQLLAQCPQGGKAILIYGPTVDISALGEVGRDVRGYVGRSGLGSCGASIAVLDELRSRNRPTTTATSGSSEEGSLKSLVSGGGQEEEVLAKIRKNLLDANVDINSSDSSYLMAEVSKKLFNVISDSVVKEVDSTIRQKGFRDTVSEVVLIGGIAIDGEEDYFLPVTFQTISGGADGTTSTNFIDNLYNADYDVLSLPQNKQGGGTTMIPSLPSVSLPKVDVSKIAVPDIKVPKVDLKLPSVSDIKAPAITLPKVSVPQLGTLPAVSKTTANTLVGAGVAAGVIGGGVLAVNKLRNKNTEQADVKVTDEPVTTPLEITPDPVETTARDAQLIGNDRKPIFSLPDFFAKKDESSATADAFPPTTQSPADLDYQVEVPEEKKFSLPSLSLPSVSLPLNPFGAKEKEESTTSKVSTEAPSSSLTTNDERGDTKKPAFSFPPISVPNPFDSKESAPTSLTTNGGESDSANKIPISIPSISIPSPLDSIRSGAIANRFRSGATSSLTDDLLALAFATNQGQDASSRQMESALDIVAKLEKLAPVSAKKLFSKEMEGTWELQFCSDPYSFRSNPFFMARRSSCSSDPILRSYYEDDCMNLQQVLQKSGSVDAVRQIVKGGQMISEIDFSTGFGKSALVSLAALRPSSAKTKLSAWDVSLRGTEIKGKYPQLARQLREIKAVMSGVIKAPPFATTYLDENVRISRDQDGAVYVFRKISDVAKPTDYSALARDTTKIIGC